MPSTLNTDQKKVLKAMRDGEFKSHEELVEAFSTRELHLIRTTKWREHINESDVFAQIQPALDAVNKAIETKESNKAQKKNTDKARSRNNNLTEQQNTPETDSDTYLRKNPEFA